MSCINSTVSSISALHFRELPSGRKVAMTAAVRVGRATVFLDSKGNIYSTQVKQRCFYAFGAGLEDTLEGCKRLGILSKEAVEEHNSIVSARTEARERKYAASYLAEHAKTLGLRLTAAQQRAIKAAQEV